MVSGGCHPPPPPGPGSRFRRWRLVRCGGHRGRHLRHVEVGLAVQVSPPCCYCFRCHRNWPSRGRSMVSGGYLPLPPPAPAPGSSVGASRVAGGIRGDISAISRSYSLFKFSPLPPLCLDVLSALAPFPAVDSPSSTVVGGNCCRGAGGAEGTCSQVTFRMVSMERWAVSTRMQSRGWSTLGPT